MRNWIIILIIFIVPLGLYGVLDMKTSAQDLIARTTAKSEAVAGVSVKNPEKTSQITVYKFYSPLCKDCQKQSKELVGLKEEFAKKVTFNEINVSGATGESDEVQKLIKKYNIQMVPTVVIADIKGKEMKKYDTVISHDELKNVLNNLILNGVK